MTHSKIDAFFEEFPWLKNFVDTTYYKSFYVSRVEPALLEYQPIKRNVSSWPFCQEWVYELLVLLDKEGDVITILFDLKNKTVGEHIEILPRVSREKISYVVSRFGYTNAVIIYKPPKGFSIPEWIEALKEEEKAKMRAEIAEIDKEGENLLLKKIPPKPEFPPNRIFHEGLFGTKEIK